MNTKITDAAKEVAKDGLIFSKDGTNLKIILEQLYYECSACPPELRVDYISSSLRVLDCIYGWVTPKVRESESDDARQARENALYYMMAQLYVYDRSGFKIGF